MAERYWPTQSLKKYQREFNFLNDSGNQPNVNGYQPVIGLAFDWKVVGRKSHGSHKFAYSGFQSNLYISFVRNAGGIPYIIGPEDSLESYHNLLDGLIICGGRDIHPEKYDEPIAGSIVPMESEMRWQAITQAYHGLPKACPILGICWGMQFINVIQGGTLVQHIHDSHSHNCKRKINLKRGSWMHDNIGPTIKGLCLHHQIIGRIGKNVEVVAVDDHSKDAHAIEVKEPGRFIIATQFHPESTFKDETFLKMEDASEILAMRFVEKCAEFRRSKAGSATEL
jgi:putative glutamine amidotransferase